MAGHRVKEPHWSGVFYIPKKDEEILRKGLKCKTLPRADVEKMLKEECGDRLKPIVCKGPRRGGPKLPLTETVPIIFNSIEFI